MKTLKFRPHLCKEILSGKKTATWRLFDDKDLNVGDRVSFLNWETKDEIAQAVLTEVRETTLGGLTAEDWEGHERFASDEEMLATYSLYYRRPVTLDAPVKIIKFRIL
jgi:hypothetical protein